MHRWVQDIWSPLPPGCKANWRNFCSPLTRHHKHSVSRVRLGCWCALRLLLLSMYVGALCYFSRIDSKKSNSRRWQVHFLWIWTSKLYQNSQFLSVENREAAAQILMVIVKYDFLKRNFQDTLKKSRTWTLLCSRHTISFSWKIKQLFCKSSETDALISAVKHGVNFLTSKITV